MGGHGLKIDGKVHATHALRRESDRNGLGRGLIDYTDNLDFPDSGEAGYRIRLCSKKRGMDSLHIYTDNLHMVFK